MASWLAAPFANCQNVSTPVGRQVVALATPSIAAQALTVLNHVGPVEQHVSVRIM
jgi:hypothetical protein